MFAISSMPSRVAFISLPPLKAPIEVSPAKVAVVFGITMPLINFSLSKANCFNNPAVSPRDPPDIAWFTASSMKSTASDPLIPALSIATLKNSDDSASLAMASATCFDPTLTAKAVVFDTNDLIIASSAPFLSAGTASINASHCALPVCTHVAAS